MKSCTVFTVQLLQLVKKSLAEFRVRRRESIIICFLPRHVRGRKHFARSERRIVRYQRTTEAQNAAKLSRKSGEATFSTVSTASPKGEAVFLCPGRAMRAGISRYKSKNVPQQVYSSCCGVWFYSIRRFITALSVSRTHIVYHSAGLSRHSNIRTSGFGQAAPD